MLHSHYTLISKPLIPLLPIVYLFPLPAHHCFLLLAVLLRLLLSLPPDSLRVLQWNAGGLRSRGTELLHFLSSHPVDLICMQEFNLNSSSSFRIPGFYALRSDLLLLSDSRSVLATLSSPPSFLLPQSLWQELSFFFSCSVELQLVPGHSFLPGNDTGDELARRGALLSPSAIPCSLYPLISCIYSSLFSDWRRTFSSKFFKTQAPSIFIEELVLPRHACCVPSRLRCNGHSFLLSYLSRTDRIESPFCIACAHPSQDIYHLILHCPTTDSLRRSLFGDSVYLRSLV